MIHIMPKMSDKEFTSRRAYTRAMTKAHEEVGKEWHTNMLPQHFTKEAAGKYKHKKRGTKYLKWKRKKWESRRPLKNGKYVKQGGEVDNVLSGDMKEMLMRVGVIRAFPTRTTVSMTGPRYVTMRNYKMNQPDKGQEIETTTREERERLADVADRSLEEAAAEGEW